MELRLSFWGEHGRVGVAGAGPWAGRYVFAYPDTLPQWWTVVVDPSPMDGVPGDMYFEGNNVMVETDAEWQIDWLPPGNDEERAEREHFGWRPLRGGAVDWMPD